MAKESIFPEDMPEEIKALLQGAIDGLVPDNVSVEVVGGDDPAALLMSVMAHVIPPVAVGCLVKLTAASVLNHSVHDECDCTPDVAWERYFGALDDMVQQAKEALYPEFLNSVEVAKFEHEVMSGLDEIDSEYGLTDEPVGEEE